MAIYRAPRPDTHYTTIRNDVLRDDRLSYRARGILAVILSNADDWNTTSEDLARKGSEGRDAIRSALTELETAGYLVRERRQDARGRWATQAVVYDTPRPSPVRTVQDELFSQVTPKTDSQASVFQSSVLQSSENQALTEHTTQKGLPAVGRDDAPAEKSPADQIAGTVYETSEKMANYMALRQAAVRALKAGYPQDAVLTVMLELWHDGRPITGANVAQALQRGKGGARRPSDTYDDHWKNGGGFTADEGGQP